VAEGEEVRHQLDRLECCVEAHPASHAAVLDVKCSFMKAGLPHLPSSTHVQPAHARVLGHRSTAEPLLVCQQCWLPQAQQGPLSPALPPQGQRAAAPATRAACLRQWRQQQGPLPCSLAAGVIGRRLFSHHVGYEARADGAAAAGAAQG
jgi:hypothetical protein